MRRTSASPWSGLPACDCLGDVSAVSIRDARLLVGLGQAQALTRGFLNVFAVVMALQLLGIGSSGVGILTAGVGVGAVAGSLGASMFVTGRRLAALEGVGVALWGLPIALSGAFPVEPAVLALMCVIGVGNALLDIGLYTLLARLVPEELLARFFGVDESLTALTVALGSLVTPFAIALFGIRGALAVLGLFAPLLVAVAWRRLRAIDASIGHRDREIELLNNVPMLRPLPIPAIDSLALHVDHAEFASGQEVFHQNDSGDRYYVIEDGQVDVISGGRLIGTLGPGEGFGEIALLRDLPRTATVRARTPLKLCALDREHFVAAVSGYQSSAQQAEDVVAARLSANDLPL